MKAKPWKYYLDFAERFEWVYQRGWRKERVRYGYATKEIEVMK